MGVVSLTMGNSGLPFGNCFVADADLLGELKLRQMLLFAQRADRRAGNIIVHIHAPFRVDFFSDHSIAGTREKSNLRCGESPRRERDSCRESALFTLYNMKVSCYNENNT